MPYEVIESWDDQIDQQMKVQIVNDTELKRDWWDIFNIY